MAHVGKRPSVADAPAATHRDAQGGLGVVLNPFAGGNRDERHRAHELRLLVGDHGVVHETGGLDEIEAAALDFRRRRIGILAICGGDGSFFRTLSTMVRVYGDEPLPCFLPLRAGSMNTIARAVGCRHGTPETVLAAVVADQRHGRDFDIAHHHLIRVNGDHYGFLVGAGLIVNFLQAYYSRPERGPLAAAMLLARVGAGGIVRAAEAVRLFEASVASITCDGVDFGRRVFPVIFASTVPEIGLGFRLAYRATAGVEGVHVLAGSLSPLQALVSLPRIRRGVGLDVEGWHDELAQRITVEFAQPTRYMIDGDILEAVERLELTTGPRLAIIRK